MKITLMAFGSRGDIQPFLALAVALRERGHNVMLAAPDDFEEHFKAHGITYTVIPLNTKAVIDRFSAKRSKRAGVTFATVRAFFTEVVPELRRAFRTAADVFAESAKGADLIISHGFLVPYALAVHQRLNIPLMLGIAAPIVTSREFSPILASVPFGKRYLYPLSYYMLSRMVTFMMIGPANAYRQRVGLPPLPGSKTIQTLLQAKVPILMHYSKHLMPVPPDWNANVQVVGQWTLTTQEDWTPPEALSAFLAQGEPPVYIGFGSMTVAHPEQMVRTISTALRLAGLRGVMQTGWAGLVHEDEHLITIGDVPHDWLFPRMAAIVHHGGSGTTHSALRAGKPALIVPFSADQPFWGRRLAELGVGVPPIAPRNLTAERLAEALRTLTQDTAMRQRAADLGELLRAEDGLSVSCDFVERYAAGTAHDSQPS